ncbi:hypothetical protein FOMG_19986 [Fusarium oxysporum f. sp. melonis 26406]|uniref:Uncharacterized protein n=1 Tax=Fusarium oxysporum f. sp. melonis 26406 TaxID=1089452 RepID=W9YUI3_FUSOX|nr:hypothetical protein FOWG_18248 [Fusarium oxysporum f. sp. lycopersici MN25]EXK23234.1 hypothetical protein FOMG_19986 [Fusarium oxysporum f. sp. melonis 26406]
MALKLRNRTTPTSTSNMQPQLTRLITICTQISSFSRKETKTSSRL